MAVNELQGEGERGFSQPENLRPNPHLQRKPGDLRFVTSPSGGPAQQGLPGSRSEDLAEVTFRCHSRKWKGDLWQQGAHPSKEQPL